MTLPTTAGIFHGSNFFGHVTYVTQITKLLHNRILYKGIEKKYTKAFENILS